MASETTNNRNSCNKVPLIELSGSSSHSQQQQQRPDDDYTYWVTHSILAGAYPISGSDEERRQTIRAFLKCGITHFIDLTEDDDDYYDTLVKEEATKLQLKQTVMVHHLGIEDFDVPTHDHMTEILNTIDRAIQPQQQKERGNNKVYIHCRAGIGRTGTVIGCYLVRHGYTGEEALREAHRLFQAQRGDGKFRNRVPETEEQIDMVRRWKEKE